jgi:Mn-dependent DtxR family transcriptional regulator
VIKIKLKVYESEETYLETILILGQNENQVRSVDIANELDYSRPSISIAMKNLREKGYIEIEKGGYIKLTEVGKKIAESMYERHKLITDWLIFLGVDKKIAVNDACKIEHVLSEQSFEAIKSHINEWKQELYK